MLLLLLEARSAKPFHFLRPSVKLVMEPKEELEEAETESDAERVAVKAGAGGAARAGGGGGDLSSRVVGVVSTETISIDSRLWRMRSDFRKG